MPAVPATTFIMTIERGPFRLAVAALYTSGKVYCLLDSYELEILVEIDIAAPEEAEEMSI